MSCERGGRARLVPDVEERGRVEESLLVARRIGVTREVCERRSGDAPRSR